MDIGIVTSIEINHKPVEKTRKGVEVCVKIETPPGDAPKMFDRHFGYEDELVSKVSYWNSYCLHWLLWLIDTILDKQRFYRYHEEVF